MNNQNSTATNAQDTGQDNSAENDSVKGYSILLTPVSIETRKDRRGKPYMKARVKTTTRDGKPVERTMMARGKALDALNDNIQVGQESRVRIIYSETEQGAPYLTALCMARHQPDKAA